jgi:hypothetical protein
MKDDGTNNFTGGGGCKNSGDLIVAIRQTSQIHMGRIHLTNCQVTEFPKRSSSPS